MEKLMKIINVGAEEMRNVSVWNRFPVLESHYTEQKVVKSA
jgi:hypothetical protein